jgi:hypothetical protein
LFFPAKKSFEKFVGIFLCARIKTLRKENFMQNQNASLPNLSAAMQARLVGLPPSITFPQLASILQRPADTVRRQYARGTLGIPVHHKVGASPYILLNDVELFLRGGHEVFESVRPVGRPTNKSKAVARKKGGAAC